MKLKMNTTLYTVWRNNNNYNNNKYKYIRRLQYYQRIMVSIRKKRGHTHTSHGTIEQAIIEKNLGDDTNAHPLLGCVLCVYAYPAHTNTHTHTCIEYNGWRLVRADTT